MKTQNSPEAVQPGLRVLWVQGPVLYASKGYQILRSTDSGASWQLDGTVRAPLLRQGLASSALLMAASRSGVFSLLPLPAGARLAVVGGAVARAEPGSGDYRVAFKFPRGSRPLNICQTPEGTLYFGEYFLNFRRTEPVNIYCSEDGGKTWDVAHAFEKGSICHVHRMVHDPFDDSLLVCTGDRDSESAILRTRDNCKTFEKIAYGSQDARTAALLPFKDTLLFGTDKPEGENFIMAVDRKTGRVQTVQAVPGPVLYGLEVEGRAVFSTMVEKPGHEATLWGGDQSGFSLVAKFETPSHGWLRREVFGYSAIVLPEGLGQPPHVFCTPQGTTEHSGELVRVRLG